LQENQSIGWYSETLEEFLSLALIVRVVDQYPTPMKGILLEEPVLDEISHRLGPFVNTILFNGFLQQARVLILMSTIDAVIGQDIGIQY